MAAGRLSSESLPRFYLQRIPALDHRGPALHAVLAINGDAVSAARPLTAVISGPAPDNPASSGGILALIALIAKPALLFSPMSTPARKASKSGFVSSSVS